MTITSKPVTNGSVENKAKFGYLNIVEVRIDDGRYYALWRPGASWVVCLSPSEATDLSNWILHTEQDTDIAREVKDPVDESTLVGRIQIACRELLRKQEAHRK